VSAAVSLSEALTVIGESYERDASVRITYNFAGSNTLALQILEGAPADVFISADEAQMTRVDEAGRLARDSRVDLLSNRLAVVAASGVEPPATAADLRAPRFRRIAVGDPAAVPAGVYARRYLEAQGVWTAVESRLLPMTNVRATLTAVESGDADAAIVYVTDALLAKQAQLAFIVGPDRGPRIVYPAAAVRGPREEAARAFVAFLRQPASRLVFERAGFMPLP
jgi:molybdate transport system substrate-binding protein